jgi:hypothetical protein
VSIGRRAVGSLIVFAAAVCISPAVTTEIQQAVSPAPSRTEALLVLRGFGYSGDGERVLRTLEPAINTAGMDLFIPDYLSRSGLDDSRRKLQRFIEDRRLARYERLHVFAYIAGAWTLNPMAGAGGLPKLATVIYDRSPYQERAPRIADEQLHFLTWVRYGSPVFDLARTPYPPLTAAAVKVGLVVETAPTSFIKDHAETARSYGPFRFDCDAFSQRFDDCMFVGMNHDDLYVRFAEVLPEVLSFIRNGRYSNAANRTAPRGDALAVPGRP